MYFPQQSPGIAHKLASHHDQSPWGRSTHPHTYGPPPPSPGYPLFANGNPMQHHIPTLQHHHQNSLSHYPSPPTNGTINSIHGQHMALGQASPGSTSSQVITPHWQQQLLKCEMIRASRSPHHRARASAMASRTVAKSAIPITNPNKHPSDAQNGYIKDTDDASSTVNGGTSAEPSPRGPSANVNHPSSTVGPVAAPRPTAAKPPQNTWSSLDMGGVNLKNIPSTSGLFSFQFLVNLYLNHNALTSVPPEISKLRNLELLDLSGNQLTNIPPELGMLAFLKELYLFDNHLTTIPLELGTLHQLQTLGIEGNPLNVELKSMVQKDGTPALISWLRDHCDPGPGPPQRTWRFFTSDAEREAYQSDPSCEQFTVLCSNILCEKYATERLYGYTPSWALAWEYRREMIMTEIRNLDADFMCFQEMDIGQYEDYFTKNLESLDYDSVFWPKSRYKTMNDVDRRLVDGCAIFFKKTKYQLIEKHLIEFSQVAMQRPDFKKTDDMFNRVLDKDHIAVVSLFEARVSGTRFVVANPHLHWGATHPDVKLVQVALLIEEVEKVANNFARYPPRLPVTSPTRSPTSTDGEATPRPPPTYSDGTKIPIIIAGDFNSIPNSGVYEYLSNGHIPPDHPDFKSHSYGRYTSEGLRHRFGLKSAYQSLEDVLLTNYTPGFKGCLDYIWYSTGTLGLNAVLGEIDRSYLEKAVGFPNAHFPSDHVSIMAEFRVKPPREAQPRPPMPVFPSSHSST